MESFLSHLWVLSGSQRMSCKRDTGLSSPSCARLPHPGRPHKRCPQPCSAHPSDTAADCETPVHPVSIRLGSAAAFSQQHHPLFAPTLLFQGFYFLGGN